MRACAVNDVLWKLHAVSLGENAASRLRKADMEIREGVTAVIGHSGAGKTSLLNLLVGFEKPDAGSIAAPRSFFWVPQNGGLWPQQTVREHLKIVSPRAEHISAMLATFDLAEKADTRPGQLSEGEQSRLAVARALMTNASALVMDEPLVHVDPARAGKYWTAIRSHLAKTGASLVFSTHSPEAVLGEAGRVICLREGHVLYAGTVDALYWNPASSELAECLGPANWFTGSESKLWLEANHDTPRCLRPEQIAVAVAEKSALVVESSQFRGSVAEVELRHEPSGGKRRFFHRPHGNHLRAGARVTLKMLALFFCALLLAGCNRSHDPEIRVRSVRSWILPGDGPLLPTPRTVAIGKNDEIATLDTGGRVIIYDATGTLLRQWKMPEITVGKPEGICVLNDGRVVVCDTHYHRVIHFDPQGRVLSKFGQKGSGPGEFIYPVAITKDDRENLYICEYGGNDRVQKFTRDGKFICAFGGFGTGPGQFQRPSGLCWNDGKVFVADAINNRVLVFSDDGKFERVLGDPAHPLALQFPYGIAHGGDGFLYIIEYGAGRLTRVTPDGKVLGRFGSTGAGERQFATPWGLAIDSKMRIRIADTKNRRIVSLEL